MTEAPLPPRDDSQTSLKVQGGWGGKTGNKKQGASIQSHWRTFKCRGAWHEAGTYGDPEAPGARAVAGAGEDQGDPGARAGTVCGSGVEVLLSGGCGSGEEVPLSGGCGTWTGVEGLPSGGFGAERRASWSEVKTETSHGVVISKNNK